MSNIARAGSPSSGNYAENTASVSTPSANDGEAETLRPIQMVDAISARFSAFMKIECEAIVEFSTR